MDNGNVKAPTRGDIFIENGKMYVFKEKMKLNMTMCDRMVLVIRATGWKFSIQSKM